ncbi:hypothetical protein FQ185_22325 [Pseudomonas sp. ANT_H12B]|nr:hypothetical protein FQ185_22325 [Pseudomonas sp. ANT_H12B]
MSTPTFASPARTLSRASPLPHLTASDTNPEPDKEPCGSGLAREGVLRCSYSQVNNCSVIVRNTSATDPNS